MTWIQVQVLMNSEEPELDELYADMNAKLDLMPSPGRPRGLPGPEEMVWVLTVLPFVAGMSTKFGEKAAEKLGEVAKRVGRRLWLRDRDSGVTILIDTATQQDPTALAALQAMDLGALTRDSVLVWDRTDQEWKPQL